MRFGVDCAFDGGSVIVVDQDDPSQVTLALRPDNRLEFLQAFNFRVRGAKGKALTLRIANAENARFAAGFGDLRAICKEGTALVPVATTFDGSELTIRHTPRSDVVFFSSYLPYDERRRAALVRRVEKAPDMTCVSFGRSVQKRPLTAFMAGMDGPKVVIVARQHPGETVAEWMMEGLVKRLLHTRDRSARALCARARLFIVPCLNIDGASLGNHRTNAAGIDLNRAWQEPSRRTSPEVVAVRRVLEDGVDFFLDVHGEETIAYAFAAGCEGNPGYTPRQEGVEDTFRAAMEDLHPAFRSTGGYDRDEAGQADLRLAANWVAETYDCPALTLEAPMKDTLEGQEPGSFLQSDALTLGEVLVEALHACLDRMAQDARAILG